MSNLRQSDNGSSIRRRHDRDEAAGQSQQQMPDEQARLQHRRRKQRNKLAETARKSVSRYIGDLNGEEPTRLYDMVISEVEKPLLEVVMKHVEGNQSRAARMLGINRNTLRKKLEQHQIPCGR